MEIQPKKLFTLCIVHQPPRVLLGMKKIRFGKGKWNGFGGHVEGGETIEDAARREMEEEAGIVVEDLEKIGINQFIYLNDGIPAMPEMKDIEIHIFRSTRFSRTPIETEEMRPQWFDADKLPFETMWPSDKLWYPLFLKGQKFMGSFVYKNYDTIASYELIDKTSL